MRVAGSMPVRFTLGAMLALAFLAWFVFRGAPDLRIETNLLQLLPRTERSAEELATISTFAERVSRELIFLVGAADPAAARAAAARFARSLDASGAFDGVHAEVDPRMLEAARALGGARHGLLAPRDRARLERGDGARIGQEALRQLYSPIGMIRPLPFAMDPLGFTADFLAAQAPRLGAARLVGNMLAVGTAARTHVVVSATMRGDPFRTDEQQRASGAIEAARNAARAPDPRVEIIGSGALLHAAAATDRAKREIALFGSISLVGVTLLVFAAFRSLWPLVFTVGTLALAAAAGIAACQLAFGSVHILTLTFGTSLTGVAVDYSVHYFALRGSTSREALIARLAPDLLTVCATTSLGYLVLLAAPIPGLRQIALSSAVGLFVACASVLCLYPTLDPSRREFTPPAWSVKLNQWTAGTAPLVLAAVVLLALIATGIARLTTADDIRALQRSSPALLADERRLRGLLHADFDTRFVLVSAGSDEQLLQRIESVADALDELVARGALADYTAVTRSLPSLRRQKESRALLDRAIYRSGILAGLLRTVGFKQASIREREVEFAAAGGQALTPRAWLASPLSAPYRRLWLEGEAGRGPASMILLGGLRDAAAVRAVVDVLAGSTYVDQVAEISNVLAHYRRIATRVLFVVLFVMVAVLALRYGPRESARLALSSIGAVALTVATFGFLGQPVTLLHVLSLLLVIGMGVDYAVFLREGKDARTMHAVVICTLTTLLSFGLLGFSSVPFVRSIGITVAFGITFAFLLSLAARPRRR